MLLKHRNAGFCCLKAPTETNAVTETSFLFSKLNVKLNTALLIHQEKGSWYNANINNYKGETTV